MNQRESSEGESRKRKTVSAFSPLFASFLANFSPSNPLSNDPFPPFPANDFGENDLNFCGIQISFSTFAFGSLWKLASPALLFWRSTSSSSRRARVKLLHFLSEFALEWISSLLFPPFFTALLEVSTTTSFLFHSRHVRCDTRIRRRRAAIPPPHVNKRALFSVNNGRVP